MGDLLGGLGRGAAALAERGGVQGLLGNAAELGVNALNAGARYAAFSAPVTAMSNAGSIYSDLLDQGYSPNEIAAQMRAMAWEEFPQDIATGIMDGVLLDGGVGRLLKGGGLLSRAGKGLASIGLGGAGEYYDELNQQIIQDKYTNKPYGTWLNPTDEEAAAAAAAALGGGLFGLGGIARNAARNPSALTPAAEESGGAVTPGSAADPVANGLIASQIAATNAAVEGAQRQALAQALAGLQARPADTNLGIPEMQEPSAKASAGAGGSGATGQAVAVQGAASGAASDATNAKERLWNAILPYAKKYNVDPRLVLAQLSHESANFDSDLARSANNYGGLTTTENTGMPQPDGNMQYARFSSPEDFVDHYFKWWGDTIKDSGSDVDAFTSKLKNEGYFGADLGSYTQAVKRHMSSLEKEGYTAAAEAKPVSGGAENAGTTENAGGVGYIASGSDAWDGFDGRYVGASSAFSQSNYDNMGKVHPETIAGVNALASEYFKRTGKKLLLNSLAGGSHPSNASEWGHAAGWKADIDNTGVDTKVFLDICEKLGIGAALEKDTHFDLSFGKGNAYMSTDQGTSDRTGTRWYEAYHSGNAAGKQGGSANANTSADATQGLSAAQIAKLLDEGDGKQQASGVPKQFFSAFYNDVGSATTNQQLIMALDSMTNAKGEFMNTRENREQLARQFPNEVQAYALQLMREGAKPQDAVPEAPHTARRIYPRPAATPHITGNISQAGQGSALQRAARPDGGDVTSSPVASPAAMTLEAERNAPQAERNAPQTGIQEARLSPAEEGPTQTQEAHTGGASPANEPAPMHIDNAAPAIEQPHTAASPAPALERNEQPSGALNTEGAKLTPEHAAFTRTIGSGQGEGAEPQESDKVRPRSMQAMAADAQQANTPHLQPADRWQGTEQVQAADTPASAQDAGAPLPTVNPTVLTALATEARSRDGRRRQGKAILDTAKAFGVDLPVPLRRVLQAGEAKKAIREAQKLLRAAGVAANAENTAGKTVRPAVETEARTNKQTAHHGARTEGDTRESRGETAGKPAPNPDAQPAEGRAKETEGRPAQGTEAPIHKQTARHAEESTGEPAGQPAEAQTERHTDKQTEERTERRTEEPRGAKFSADLSGEKAAEGVNTRTVQETRAEAHTESTEGIKKDHTETVREITEEEKKEYALPAGYRTESGRDVFDAKPNEFILRPNGSKNFGEIPEAIEKATGGKVKAAPVRLKAGNIGSGYIHLAVKHGGQMAMKGYTVMDFINHTLQNFNQVYSQQTEKRPNRFAVYCKGDEAKGFIPVDLEIEQGEGNYYNIVSAMPHRDNIKGLVLFDGSATPSADTTNGTLIQDGNNNGGVASQSAFRKSTSPIKNSISQNTEGRKNESIPKKKKADELGEYSTTLKDILRKNPELADSLSDAQYQQVLVHMKNNNGTVKDGVYTFPTNRDKKNFSATVFAILHEINRNGKASLRGDAAKLHKMIMEAAPVLNEALTKQQKNIAALGDRMGTPVVWVDGAKGLNGFHADGVTFLNRRAGMSLPKVFWHESFHYMRAHNPALYDAIAAHVQEAQRITPEQINGYRRKLGRYDLSDADVIEEMLADKMQDASERAGLFKAMAIENRSLAARAAAWMRRMIDRFVEHFRWANDRLSEKQTAAMARAFSAVMRDMKGADGLPLFRVRGTYVRTATGAELPALNLQARARFSMTNGDAAAEKLEADNAEWNELCDRYDKANKLKWKKRYNGHLYDLMDMPLVLHMLGAGEMKLQVYGSFFAHALARKHHGMDISILKDLPKAMADPVMIFRGNKPNSYVFNLETKDRNGNPVLSTVEIERKDEKYGIINIVNTVFGKERMGWFSNQIKNGNLLYMHRKKAQTVAGPTGLGPVGYRSPNGNPALKLRAFDTSIKTDADLVKLKNEYPEKYSVIIENNSAKSGDSGENKIKFSVNFEENQRVNRSFLDRIAERFGRQLGLKADRIITEERQTNRERNMTLLDYLFSSPSRVAEKYQLFRAFFNIGDRAYNLLTERRTYFNKKLDTAMRLAKKKEDYEDLRAVLLAGDAEQKEYTKAELLVDGVKENVADAYLGVRETLKELYNMANEAHRRPSVHTRNGLTQAQVDELKANKFVRILRQDADAAGKFSVTYREYANRENTFADVTPEALKGMQADEAMQILEATKNAAGTYTVKVREGRPALHELTGYIPHFFHEYMVRVTDASGKILRTIGSGRTEREAVTFAKAWQKENALADGEVLRIAPKTFDWTQAGLDERQYAPIMGDMDYYAMVNKLAENTGQTVKEAEEMLSGAVRLKTRHRFFGNAQHRKGVNGFEKEDLNWILRHYANSACRYYAMETEGKPKLINLYERVFGAFDKDPSTTLGRYTKQYINDLNGNPSDLEKAINETLDRCPLYRKFFVARYGERAALAVAGKLSGTIASLCLGFGNVSTALLNFTQAINGTAYIGEAKAYGQIFHEGARRRFTAEEQRVLNETNVENDVGMDSGAGYDKARYSVGSLWGKVTRAGMFFFKESEGIVRRGTVLTAYKTARKRGMSHDQAILFAKEVNRKSNFEYAVTDAPNIFRRGSVFAQLALQFKKYPIKQMEVVWDMLPRRHDTKIKTKQKILFWVPYFLTSGLLGIPAFGLPDDWFDDKFSLGLKKYLMEWAGSDRAKRMAAEIALYGMPSLFGADVSNRVGLGDIIPTRGTDLAGPAVSKILSFGKDAFNGDGASALRDVSPGLYNIYAAFGAGESTGKRGRTNNRYLTAQDRLLRAMGFRSVKESTASDVSRIETMEKKDAAAEKQKAVDAYIEEPTSENKAKLKELGVKDKTVETERKKKGQTRLQRTRDTLSKKDQKAKKDQALFEFAGAD